MVPHALPGALRQEVGLLHQCPRPPPFLFFSFASYLGQLRETILSFAGERWNLPYPKDDESKIAFTDSCDFISSQLVASILSAKLGSMTESPKVSYFLAPSRSSL